MKRLKWFLKIVLLSSFGALLLDLIVASLGYYILGSFWFFTGKSWMFVFSDILFLEGALVFAVGIFVALWSSSFSIGGMSYSPNKKGFDDGRDEKFDFGIALTFAGVLLLGLSILATVFI